MLGTLTNQRKEKQYLKKKYMFGTQGKIVPQQIIMLDTLAN